MRERISPFFSIVCLLLSSFQDCPADILQFPLVTQIQDVGYTRRTNINALKEKPNRTTLLSRQDVDIDTYAGAGRRPGHAPYRIVNRGCPTSGRGACTGASAGAITPTLSHRVLPYPKVETHLAGVSSFFNPTRQVGEVAISPEGESMWSGSRTIVDAILSEDTSASAETDKHLVASVIKGSLDYHNDQLQPFCFLFRGFEDLGLSCAVVRWLASRLITLPPDFQAITTEKIPEELLGSELTSLADLRGKLPKRIDPALVS
jgi:hypothetical protein